MFSNVFLRVGYVYIRIYVVVLQCLCVRMCVCVYVCVYTLFTHVQYIKCITYTKNVMTLKCWRVCLKGHKYAVYCNYLKSILLSNAFSCIPLVEEQL